MASFPNFNINFPRCLLKTWSCDVYEILSTLESTKSTDPDGIIFSFPRFSLLPFHEVSWIGFNLTLVTANIVSESMGIHPAISLYGQEYLKVVSMVGSILSMLITIIAHSLFAIKRFPLPLINFFISVQSRV